MSSFNNSPSNQSSPSPATVLLVSSPRPYPPRPTTLTPIVSVLPVQQQPSSFTTVVSPYPVQQLLQVPVQVVSPTLTVMQQHSTVTTTPVTNTLHIRDVPSPRVSLVIPHHRSPRPQQQRYQLVPVQTPQQQQQRQSSPLVVLNVFATPQQVHPPLPGSTPGPAQAPLSSGPDHHRFGPTEMGGSEGNPSNERPARHRR